jgi:hypothetical protein
MATGTPSRVECKDCGTAIAEPSDTPLEKRTPCPSCGSILRRSYVEAVDTLEFHASLGFKVKRQGGDKPSLEGKTGDDLHRKTGKWMKKEQVVDRENDQYKEVVTDPESGKEVHRCEEPLSQHRDHGSAKKNARVGRKK